MNEGPVAPPPPGNARLPASPRRSRAVPSPFVVAGLLTALLAGGCGADASHGAASGVGSVDDGQGAAPPLPVGTLAATTPGGTHVQVTFAPDPPVVGEVDLTLNFRSAPPDPGQVSVDLVSPEMPAHGVTRHEALPGDEPGRFHVRVPIPMEGLWEFYVNLDIGIDAVSFEVHVPAGADGRSPAQPEHHGAHGPDGDHRHQVP